MLDYTMPIRTFELFHGAVLTKLVRSGHPVTLRLIETGSLDAWGMYRINDEVNLLLKYSTIPKPHNAATRWDFVVSPTEMTALSKGTTWLVLIGGSLELHKTTMEVCLLEPDEIKKLFHLKGLRESVYVRAEQGKSLRVGPPKQGQEELVIPRSRLETWRVPGS